LVRSWLGIKLVTSWLGIKVVTSLLEIKASVVVAVASAKVSFALLLLISLGHGLLAEKERLGFNCKESCRLSQSLVDFRLHFGCCLLGRFSKAGYRFAKELEPLVFQTQDVVILIQRLVHFVHF